MCYYESDDVREAMRCFDSAVAWQQFTGSDDGMLNRRYLVSKLLHNAVGPVKQRVIVENFHDMVGKSDAMQEVYAEIEKIAAVDVNVLITGETGTGKELVAKAIHRESKRKDCEFLQLDCGTIPDEMAENELFGHEKGAFTGGDEQYKGAFEQAQGGTLFLDEIGNVSMKLQAKLLRAIDNKEIRRLGGKGIKKVDMRILLATKENLEEAVGQGTFRKDLYFRVNVFQIELPPLRERKEDISLLLDHFINLYSGSDGRVRGISQNAKTTLTNYSWPGNVRELENVIKVAVVMADGKMIHLRDIPEKIRNPLICSGDLGKDILKESRDNKGIKKMETIAALEATAWNFTKAAEMLCVTRQTIHNRLNGYGVTREEITKRRNQAKVSK